MPAAPTHTNRLARETSPYLLQHAHNPVDWHPWGEEAFEVARHADKPIFLSVGYSTCYWCHVMERESFESEAIARIMNEHFVCIKVDREERPDVDDIYMHAVQIFTELTTGRRSGGWPMSVWLEPHSLKPFFAGTYFPADQKYGRQSFPIVLQFLAQVWREQREAILAQANQIAELVTSELAKQPEPEAIGREQVETAVALLNRIYDREHGGFGHAPKFPQPVFLELLIGAAWDDENPRGGRGVRGAVLHTLDRMAIGGMDDQIGGGFHRYSVDEKWLVPHFEKMLYDNGQLASVYAAAFERTGDPFHAEVLRETLDYVLREMTDEATGAFFSAQDAEVNAREGLNYLWSAEEVRFALRDAGLHEDVEFALSVYGLDPGPNFQDPHHPDDEPKNVLFLRDRPDRVAREMNVAIDAFNARLQRVNQALLAARATREQPGTDDKVLTGWNGLMIAGLADGGRVLGERKYLDAARRAASFLLSEMKGSHGGMLRSHRRGESRIDAFLEDYALLTRGLLALHRATEERTFLDDALELVNEAGKRFGDPHRGGYFDTLADQSDLFVRAKSSYDGAVPSGNGVMALNLIELHERTGEERFLDAAIATLRGISSDLRANPVSTAASTLALHRVLRHRPNALSAGGPATHAVQADPVRVTLSTNHVMIADGRDAKLELQIDIDPNHHINAHDPGDRSLVGLDIEFDAGSGLTLHVEYPQGDLYRDAIRVHTDRLTVPLRIEKIGNVLGRPRLLVTYQACTDEACLAPVTRVLPLNIESR